VFRYVKFEFIVVPVSPEYRPNDLEGVLVNENPEHVHETCHRELVVEKGMTGIAGEEGGGGGGEIGMVGGGWKGGGG